MKKGLVLLTFIYIIIFSSCSRPDISIFLEQQEIYKLYNYEWLNEENVIIQMSIDDNEKLSKEDGYNKTYLFNIKNNKQKLLFSGGVAISGNSSRIVFGDNNANYVYGEADCQIYNSLKFNRLLNFKEEEIEVFGNELGAIEIAKDGMCATKLESGEIAIFPISDMKNYRIVAKITNELVNGGNTSNGKLIPARFYGHQPCWSPDGKWITCLEFDSLTNKVISIVAFSRDGKQKISFDFKTVSDIKWSDDSKYLVGICRPTWEGDKKEIRVFDADTGTCKSYLFEESIDGIEFGSIELLDIGGSSIALRCDTSNYLSGHVELPVLLFDYKSGEKKWITSSDYYCRIAKFSPDGKSLLLYGKNSNEEKCQMKIISIE